MLDIEKLRRYSLVLFICLLFVASLVRFAPIWGDGAFSFSRFIKYGADYRTLREAPYIAHAGSIVRQVVPPGSSVKIITGPWDVYTVWFQYSLYPLEVKPDGDYWIDITRSLSEDQTKGMKTFTLGDGITIYAKPGHEFNTKGRISTVYPQGRNILVFLLVCAFLAFTGSVILGCFRMPKNDGGVWAYWSMSYLIGFFVMSASLWGWLMTGGVLTRESILLVWGGVFFISWLCSKRRLHAYPAVLPQEHSTLPQRGYMSLFSLLTIAAITAVVCDSIMNVMTVWDEMTHWIMQAKMISFHQRLDLHYTTYNYYPMLWPVHVAAQFVLMGGMYDEAARWASSLAFLSLLGQIYGMMRILGIRSQLSFSFLGLYIIVFHHPLMFSTALPENLLMAFMAATTALFLRWFNDTSRIAYLCLAVFVSAGMSCVKTEGFIVAILYALALLLLARSAKLPKRSIVWICLLFAMPLIPAGWTLWLQQQGYTNSLYHLSHGFSWQKLGLVMEVFKLKLSSQNSLFILLAVSMVFAARNHRPYSVSERFLFIMSVGLIGFAAVAALGWPVEHIIPYFVETSGRLLIHASPFVFLLWVSRVFRTDSHR